MALTSEAAPSGVFSSHTASLHKYGFRFLSSEVAMFERVFSQTGGATPLRHDLEALAASCCRGPLRGAASNPVTPKQIKTWFENRRQKGRRALRPSNDAEERLVALSSTPEQDDDGAVDGTEEDGIDGVLAAARVLVAASSAPQEVVEVPVVHSHQQWQRSAPQLVTISAPASRVGQLSRWVADSASLLREVHLELAASLADGVPCAPAPVLHSLAAQLHVQVQWTASVMHALSVAAMAGVQ